MFSVIVMFRHFKCSACTSSQRGDQKGLCELKKSGDTGLGMSHANKWWRLQR